MTLPPNWQALDGAFAAHVDAHAARSDRWLLAQTLATADQRRAVLGTLPVQSGWRTLDIGTGFGPVAMELAAMVPVDSVGIDLDPDVLEAAEAVRVDAAQRGAFTRHSRIRFEVGDVYALDRPDASIDLATARFVFQHLRDHVAAKSELARVVRPGGLVCLSTSTTGCR